jgi:ketosteroid isomerase-like protein
MNDQEKSDLVRNFYAAYAGADRGFIESHMAEGFVFSAPPDPYLDHDGYFERCWPGAGKNQTFAIERSIVSNNEVVVTYEMSHEDGTKGRNTEIFTLTDGKIRRVEVYFGWNIA